MKNGVEVPRHMVVNRGEDSEQTDGECRTKKRRGGGGRKNGKEGKRGREGVVMSYLLTVNGDCYQYLIHDIVDHAVLLMTS